MTRLFVTLFGAFALGIAVWSVVGSIAAWFLSRSGGHDGGPAMAGMFVIGGFAGAIGAIIGGIVLWRLLADPSRVSTAGLGSVGLLAVVIIGWVIAMQPTYVEYSDFPPDKRGEFQVEARVPGTLPVPESLLFQLRAGDGTLEGGAQKAGIHRDGDGVIVPAAIAVKQVRQWVLGIMQGDRQLDTATVGIDRHDGILTESTDWSAWTPTDSGLQVRWRFVVLPR